MKKTTLKFKISVVLGVLALGVVLYACKKSTNVQEFKKDYSATELLKNVIFLKGDIAERIPELKDLSEQNTKF